MFIEYIKINKNKKVNNGSKKVQKANEKNQL
jgi:hypothetical protein